MENEETNPIQTDICDDVTSRSTVEGLRHFRIDKEEISKDQSGYYDAVCVCVCDFFYP